MTAQVIDDLGESKAERRLVGKIWFATCEDIFDHEVVGPNVKCPKPVDPKRPAWAPMIVWQWLIKEAARQDRIRVLQGKAIALRRGQLAVSQWYLAREANWGRKAVRCFFERLQRFEMVTLSVTSGSQLALNFLQLEHNSAEKGQGITVVTLCNYDKYQHAPSARGQRGAKEGPSKGQGGAKDNTENIDTRNNKKKDSGSRGTRLPKDWVLPDEWREWAEINFSPDAAVIASEAERFRDYWIAVSGAKGLKADWAATWRNWCRQAHTSASVKRRPIVIPGGRASGADRARAFLEEVGMGEKVEVAA